MSREQLKLNPTNIIFVVFAVFLVFVGLPMSGHSKWSKVKHQKATTDVVKAQVFTKASGAITIAIRQGGGVTDPGSNFRLRLAIDKAKFVNMPKENIERAIKRAVADEGRNLTHHVYEGFGPSGCAILILVQTDNPNRIVSAIKNILDRAGGSLAGPGAVSHLFIKRGVVTVKRADIPVDTVTEWALEAGAEDVTQHEDMYEIRADVTVIAEVRAYFERLPCTIVTSDIVYLPVVPQNVSRESEGAIRQLVSGLVMLDEVSNVYTNVV